MALRSRSLLLTTKLEEAATDDGPILRIEVLTSLQAAGISKESIDGIEYQSKIKWFVVFKDAETRNKNIDTQITIRQETYALEHPNPAYQKRQTQVKVYGYPLDSDTQLLARVLGYYGPVKGMKDMVDKSCDIKTGVKDVLIELKQSNALPSYISVGKHQVRLEYRGQRRTSENTTNQGMKPASAKPAPHVKSAGQQNITNLNAQTASATDVTQKDTSKATARNTKPISRQWRPKTKALKPLQMAQKRATR